MGRFVKFRDCCSFSFMVIDSSMLAIGICKAFKELQHVGGAASKFLQFWDCLAPSPSTAQPPNTGLVQVCFKHLSRFVTQTLRPKNAFKCASSCSRRRDCFVAFLHLIPSISAQQFCAEPWSSLNSPESPLTAVLCILVSLRALEREWRKLSP